MFVLLNAKSIPVLVLAGNIYPALGGDFPGNFALSSTQALASNVTGVTVPLSGHWISEERATICYGAACTVLW